MYKRQVPGSVMVRISSFLVFLLSDVVLVCFHIYVCVYLFSKKERRTLKRVKAGYVIAAVEAAFVVLSQFTHWYYYIDAVSYTHLDVYKRQAVSQAHRSVPEPYGVSGAGSWKE